VSQRTFKTWFFKAPFMVSQRTFQTRVLKEPFSQRVLQRTVKGVSNGKKWFSGR